MKDKITEALQHSYNKQFRAQSMAEMTGSLQNVSLLSQYLNATFKNCVLEEKIMRETIEAELKP